MDIKKQLENTEYFNELLKDSVDFEEDFGDNILIDLENSKEILLRKKVALEQAIDLLKYALTYGSCDSEILVLEKGIKNTEEDIKEVEEGIKNETRE